MAQVTVTELTSPTALYCHYDRQTNPQPCYIALDTRDSRMWADYNAEIGNAVPMDVWHGMVRRYSIPILRSTTANELMRDLVPVAARVVDGTSIDWDGSNHVASLNEDAQQAEAEINEMLDLYRLDGEPDLHFADASDWLFDERDALVARLKAGEPVSVLEAELDDDGSDETRPILHGLTHYLEHLVEDMAD
jgi:hypothetical protein